MLIKAGVDISRLNREIRRALTICGNIGRVYMEDLVVTSTYDGNHSPGSLHYSNDAFDIRRPKIHWDEYTLELGHVLSEDYDVVLESDHIHIEYDPKQKRGKR